MTNLLFVPSEWYDLIVRGTALRQVGVIAHGAGLNHAHCEEDARAAGMGVVRIPGASLVLRKA